MNTFKKYKILIIAFLVFLTIVILQSTLLRSGNLATLEVNSYGHNETFIVKQVISKTENCIDFIDGFGIKRKVCGNYTLSQY